VVPFCRPPTARRGPGRAAQASRPSSTYSPGISFLRRLTTLAVLALGGPLVTPGQL